MRVARTYTVAVALVLSLASTAAALDGVLLPAAPLAADGSASHLLRLYLVDHDRLLTAIPTLRALRGAIVGTATPVSDGGLALRYRPPRVTAPATDTLIVTLRGRELRLPLALEPAGTLKLTLEVPAQLTLQKGATATVKLHARDPAGRPARAPLRVSASVGRLSPPRETAPGEYELTFTPPEERYPQTAILAALAISDGAFTAATIRLAARVTVEGEGEPGARMQISVDGRPFPATLIGDNGRFAVPLIVPPGGRALGVSVDKLGNESRREIDLALPPFPRVILSAVPPVLPADGRARAEIVAFAVDARGNPERRAPPPLTSDAGTLSPPTVRGDGSTRWTLTAPEGMGAGVVSLRAPGGEARVSLRPGAPRSIEVIARDPLYAGSDTPATVDALVADGAGTLVPGATLTAALAGGRVLDVKETGGGHYALSLLPPRDPGRGTAQLHVEVAAVAPGPPRRVTLHALPATRASDGEFGAEAWIDDDLGLPVAGARVELRAPGAAAHELTDRYGTARIRYAAPAAGSSLRAFRVTADVAELPGAGAALDVLIIGGVAHAVGSVAGHGIVEPGEAPSFPAVDAPLPLTPAAPVDLRVSVEPKQPRPGQAARVSVALHGASQLLYQASGGTLEVVRPATDGAAELRFTPPADAKSGARYLISVTDARTRVTAFVEVIVP